MCNFFFGVCFDCHFFLPCSSCFTHQWTTWSAWQQASFVNSHSTSSRLRASTAREHPLRLWSCCTPTTRESVRRSERAFGVAFLNTLFCKKKNIVYMMTLIKMTNISLTLLKKTFFFFLQQLMLLPCCSASLRIRTLITKSECPWSSHTLCSNMIQLHGRWWVQGDGQVLEFYIKKNIIWNNSTTLWKCPCIFEWLFMPRFYLIFILLWPLCRPTTL